ncbi:hypothetical protein ISF_04831 [Cordyceps fumosorosea ARSEF 2679]|uniref:Uncharacterized protein n=1 Tax=Cordyceps fumosorosea (strain ARSEF 2679) TaxID=1081104 RepID=A0A167VT46_CORFA|nr:hypothetical protein ISF_04831 [Cordyceps fumosorosea ARSEF 2679]OAA62955.1 hypothetical protein ISF_04831 [Cordyceps fumosorosea ARSEF 2679]
MARFFQRRRKQVSSMEEPAAPSDEEPIQSTLSSATDEDSFLWTWSLSSATDEEFIQPTPSSASHEFSFPERQKRPSRLRRSLHKLWTRVVTRLRGAARPETPPPPPPSPLQASTREARMTTESFQRLREIMPVCVVQVSDAGYRPSDPGDPGYYTHRPTAAPLPLWSRPRPPAPAPAPTSPSNSFYGHLRASQSASDHDGFSIVSSISDNGYFSVAMPGTPLEPENRASFYPSDEEAEESPAVSGPSTFYSHDYASRSVSDYNGPSIVSSIDNSSILPAARQATPFDPQNNPFLYFNAEEEESPAMNGPSTDAYAQDLAGVGGFYGHDYASRPVSDYGGPNLARSISNNSILSTVRPSTPVERENRACFNPGESRPSMDPHAQYLAGVGGSYEHDCASRSVSDYDGPSLVSSNNTIRSTLRPATPGAPEGRGWFYCRESGAPTDARAHDLPPLERQRSASIPTIPMLAQTYRLPNGGSPAATATLELYDPFDESAGPGAIPLCDLHHPIPVRGRRGPWIKFLPGYMHPV